MATLGRFVKFLLVLVLLGLVGWAFIANYSVIFAKTVIGELTAVERVEMPMALISRANTEINSKVFSFAVGIKDINTGEIATASSEDRQWAVAEKGQCVEAVFLPYPPWQLTKRNTFFGARLVRLFECSK